MFDIMKTNNNFDNKKIYSNIKAITNFMIYLLKINKK